MVCGPRRQKSRLAAQYRQLSADVRDAYQAQLSVARYFAGSSTVRCVRRRAKWFACCSAHCQPGWLGIAIFSTMLLVLNVGAVSNSSNYELICPGRCMSLSTGASTKFSTI